MPKIMGENYITHINKICKDLGPKEYLGHNLVTTSLDIESTELFPIPRSYEWSSLKKLTMDLSIEKSIVMATPLLWQVEHLAYEIAKSIRVPLASTTPRNLQIVKPYIEEAGIDIIIVAQQNLSELRTILKDCTRQPKAILAITDRPSELPNVTDEIIVLEEIHLMPGIPLFYQSVTNQDYAGPKRYSKNKLFDWSIDSPGARPSITGPADWTVPITDLEIPFTITPVDQNNELVTIQAV